MKVCGKGEQEMTSEGRLSGGAPFLSWLLRYTKISEWIFCVPHARQNISVIKYKSINIYVLNFDLSRGLCGPIRCESKARSSRLKTETSPPALS